MVRHSEKHLIIILHLSSLSHNNHLETCLLTQIHSQPCLCCFSGINRPSCTLWRRRACAQLPCIERITKVNNELYGKYHNNRSFGYIYFLENQLKVTTIYEKHSPDIDGFVRLYCRNVRPIKWLSIRN